MDVPNMARIAVALTMIEFLMEAKGVRDLNEEQSKTWVNQKVEGLFAKLNAFGYELVEKKR